MNQLKLFSGIVVLIIVATIAWYALPSTDTESDAMMQESDVMKEDTVTQKDEAMMGEEESMMSAGSYELYAPEKIAAASTGETVLLFFHAPWCPICRGIESEIMADPAKLPAGVRILKVDYDRELALRKQYGITMQHTFVEVDSAGTLLQKFSDTTTLAAVLERVK